MALLSNTHLRAYDISHSPFRGANDEEGTMKGLAYIDADGNPAVWTDHKKRLWLWGLFVPTALFFAVGLMMLLGIGSTPLMYLAPVLWWIGPILLYVILPIVDIKAGDDGENPPEEVMEALENSKYYKWLTFIFLPFQAKSKFSMMRMSRLTPYMKELEKKHEGNKQKYQEEVAKLYKEEKINPMSGCLCVR